MGDQGCAALADLGEGPDLADGRVVDEDEQRGTGTGGPGVLVEAAFGGPAGTRGVGTHGCEPGVRACVLGGEPSHGRRVLGSGRHAARLGAAADGDGVVAVAGQTDGPGPAGNTGSGDHGQGKVVRSHMRWFARCLASLRQETVSSREVGPDPGPGKGTGRCGGPVMRRSAPQTREQLANTPCCLCRTPFSRCQQRAVPVVPGCRAHALTRADRDQETARSREAAASASRTTRPGSTSTRRPPALSGRPFTRTAWTFSGRPLSTMWLIQSNRGAKLSAAGSCC